MIKMNKWTNEICNRYYSEEKMWNRFERRNKWILENYREIEKCDYLRRTSRSNWSVGNNETVTGKRRKSVRRVASRPGKSDRSIQNSRQNYFVNAIECLRKKKKKKIRRNFVEHSTCIYFILHNENLCFYFRENNLAF